MKIGIIQATSQKSKNPILEKCTKKETTSKDEVINFGIFPQSDHELSYVQISLLIALLINTKAVDFVITGCSSGQGMMLACNTFSNIQCGYLPTPQDAYLFAQINNGNVASLPLGLNWGWCGELNCFNILNSLFKDKMGKGYSPQDASRKIKNTLQVKQLNKQSKISMLELLPQIDKNILYPVLDYEPVYNFIISNGKNISLIRLLKELKNE